MSHGKCKQSKYWCCRKCAWQCEGIVLLSASAQELCSLLPCHSLCLFWAMTFCPHNCPAPYLIQLSWLHLFLAALPSAMQQAIICYSVKHVEALRRYMATFLHPCGKPYSFSLSGDQRFLDICTVYRSGGLGCRFSTKCLQRKACLVLGIFSFSSISVRFLIQCLQTFRVSQCVCLTMIASDAGGPQNAFFLQ